MSSSMEDTERGVVAEQLGEAGGEGGSYRKELRSHPTSASPDRPAIESGGHHLATPTLHSERRTTDVVRMTNGNPSELRSAHRSLNAAGPQTFDHKYMPFAAGFAHMADEAAVYRSTRLHAINPTAAVSDDISYYYTLDSGRIPPAALAANPESAEEFVRNTATATHGGMFRRLMKPIR